jgi:hypothetical protein
MTGTETDSTGIRALRDLLGSNFQFFRHWYNFHYNLDSHADDDSDSDRVPRKVLDTMLTSVPFRVNAKRKILHERGLSERVDYGVDSPVLPFAMLQPATLCRLVPIAGAMACFKDLNKVVEKRELGSIFDLIGKDVYTFVVKRSLIFWKKIPNLNEDFSGIKLARRIPMCGKSIFECVTSSLPEFVIKRMSMRSGIDFCHADGCTQESVTKAVEFVKYVLANFFSDYEDVKLCLR